MRTIEAYSPGDLETCDEGERFAITAEKENPDSHFINLLEMLPDEKSKLIQEVKKWNGFVHVFVHPYYRYGSEGKYDYYSEPTKEPEGKIEELWEYLKNILQEDPRYPVIILEENWKEDYGLIKAIVNKINIGNVFFVPTWQSGPTPAVKGLSVPKSRVDLERNSDIAWQEFKHLLTEVGTKTIYVDGMYLGISDEYEYCKQKLDYYLGIPNKTHEDKEVIEQLKMNKSEMEESPVAKQLKYCVGITLRKLTAQSQFEVKLGQHTNIDREELRGLGLDEILPNKPEQKEQVD